LDCVLSEVQTQAEGLIDNINMNITGDADFALLEVQSEAEEIFDNLYYISGTVPLLPYPKKVATTDYTLQTQFNTPKTWETKPKHPSCQTWSSAIYSLSTTSSHLARLIS